MRLIVSRRGLIERGRIVERTAPGVVENPNIVRNRICNHHAELIEGRGKGTVLVKDGNRVNSGIRCDAGHATITVISSGNTSNVGTVAKVVAAVITVLHATTVLIA